MGGSGLNMSRRIRRTPFTDKVESYGVTGFTVVNHMLLPKSFKKSVEEDYWHLRENVQIWDVSCQRLCYKVIFSLAKSRLLEFS